MFFILLKLLTFVLLYIGNSFILRALPKLKSIIRNITPMLSDVNVEIWDDGEVAWYLPDITNNSYNSSNGLQIFPNKRIHIIPSIVQIA
jgi:hypothetical protein